MTRRRPAPTSKGPTAVSDTYPHDLAGEPAAAPTNPTPDEADAARALFAAPDLFAAGPWRLAAGLHRARTEADAANPHRDRRSDGAVGDAAHAARPSDHNVNTLGVVRALDLDVDGLDLAAAFERIRVAAHTGLFRCLRAGGYLILNRRITRPDWSGWAVYTGPNPHTAHGHLSAATSPADYDDATPWGVFAPTPAPVAPRPPAPTPATASGFRAAYGQRGPHVHRLQVFLTTRYPLYCKWNPTDYYGDKTAAGVREFAHRSEIPEADGLNVGPKIAAALARAGFGG